MDKYSFFKNLNLDNEIIKIIENDIFLENYSIGEELLNPEIPINKFSIILSGSIRQIKRDSTKNTNIYKYVKNDFLFIPELIYSISNPYFYVASSDLKLISVERDNFLNLISKNNEFRKWINSQIFKNEKIAILQKLFKEKFNNSLDKEKLLRSFSENINILDEKIFRDIQSENLKSDNVDIYSISKSSDFDFLEKISFSKLLSFKFEELPKIFIIDNKFMKLKTEKNKIPKIEEFIPFEEESFTG